MTRAMANSTRRMTALAAVAAFVGSVAAQHGCVIAQPSGDVPRLPPTRPTIIHASVVPSTSTVITHFPKKFVVPVELVDPSAAFEFSTFIDFNPLTGTSAYADGPTGSPPPPNPVDRIRVLEITIPEPLDPSFLGRCHNIEVVVGLNLTTADGKAAHTPPDPGGDVVSWFYNPSGDLAGCPSLDAGVDLDAHLDGDGVK
jgi:hypothetical protein